MLLAYAVSDPSTQEDEDLEREQQMEEGPASGEDEEAEAMEEDGRMPGTDLALYGAHLVAQLSSAAARGRLEPVGSTSRSAGRCL